MDSDIELMDISLAGVAPISVLHPQTMPEKVATEQVRAPISSVPRQRGPPHRVTALPAQIAEWQGAYAAAPSPKEGFPASRRQPFIKGPGLPPPWLGASRQSSSTARIPSKAFSRAPLALPEYRPTPKSKVRMPSVPTLAQVPSSSSEAIFLALLGEPLGTEEMQPRG